MSLTALLWVALYCSAVVLAFLNPLYGALGYLLEYYMRPALKWWGDELPGARYNLIISVVLATSFFLRRSSLPRMAAVPNVPARWLVALGAIMLFVNLTVAVDTELSWDWSVQWVKMAIIFPLLVVGVLRSRNAFDLFVVAHLLGAFWWGWEAWMDPRRSAGRLMNIGSGDSLHDNAAAAHLLTALPFAVIFLLAAQDRKLRLVGLLSTPFIINTIVLCNSRGAFVALIAALAASVLLVRSGNRLRLVVAGIGFLGALYFFADEQFITRQQSTAQYEEDGSARQRLSTWVGGLELVRAHPLGTGGRGFHVLSPIYIPSVVDQHDGDRRAPHNSYVMAASEWGIAGFICYLGVHLSTFMILRRTKMLSTASGDSFYYWRALAIQLALIAHMIAAVFSDRVYGESGYWMIALAYALYRIQATERQRDGSSVGRDAHAARRPVAVTQAS